MEIEREREPAGSMPFGRFGESRIASFLLPGLCFPLTSHPLNRAGPLGSRLAPLLSSPVPNPPGLPADPFCLTFVRSSDRPTDRSTVTRRVKGLLKRMLLSSLSFSFSLPGVLSASLLVLFVYLASRSVCCFLFFSLSLQVANTVRLR